MAKHAKPEPVVLNRKATECEYIGYEPTHVAVTMEDPRKPYLWTFTCEGCGERWSSDSCDKWWME